MSSTHYFRPGLKRNTAVNVCGSGVWCGGFGDICVTIGLFGLEIAEPGVH